MTLPSGRRDLLTRSQRPSRNSRLDSAAAIVTVLSQNMADTPRPAHAIVGDRSAEWAIEEGLDAGAELDLGIVAAEQLPEPLIAADQSLHSHPTARTPR